MTCLLSLYPRVTSIFAFWLRDWKGWKPLSQLKSVTHTNSIKALNSRISTCGTCWLRGCLSLCVSNLAPESCLPLSSALWNHPVLLFTSIKSLHLHPPPYSPLHLPINLFRWPQPHKDRLTCLFYSIGELNIFLNVVFYKSATLNEYSL